MRNEELAALVEMKPEAMPILGPLTVKDLCEELLAARELAATEGWLIQDMSTVRVLGLSIKQIRELKNFWLTQRGRLPEDKNESEGR